MCKKNWHNTELITPIKWVRVAENGVKAENKKKEQALTQAKRQPGFIQAEKYCFLQPEFIL